MTHVPASGPVNERRIECRDEQLETVFDDTELQGGPEIDNAPPNDERIQQRIDGLRGHRRQVIAQPQVFTVGTLADRMKTPDIESLTDQVGEQRTEHETRREIEDRSERLMDVA